TRRNVLASSIFFILTATAHNQIYTLSLHDALPIYTDQNHLHNHICINSVNMETGKKFVNDRQKLYEIRTQSDALCQQYELSIVRSEEHTSELQSRFDLVCRLLLEKKK